MESGAGELAENLSAQIKERVRQDKEEHLLSQLEEVTTQRYKWEGLKKLRAKFTPSFTKFKDSSGNHVPDKDYPLKAADYLQNVQEKKAGEDPQQPSRQNVPLQNGTYLVDDSPFATLELDDVLSKIKSNKTPG